MYLLEKGRANTQWLEAPSREPLKPRLLPLQPRREVRNGQPGLGSGDQILLFELWLLFQTLLDLVQPARALTDTVTAHMGLCRGRGWCTAAIRPRADMWRKFWSAVGR